MMWSSNGRREKNDRNPTTPVAIIVEASWDSLTIPKGAA
jgi:hypothetical protein